MVRFPVLAARGAAVAEQGGNGEGCVACLAEGEEDLGRGVCAAVGEGVDEDLGLWSARGGVVLDNGLDGVAGWDDGFALRGVGGCDD